MVSSAIRQILDMPIWKNLIVFSDAFCYTIFASADAPSTDFAQILPMDQGNELGKLSKGGGKIMIIKYLTNHKRLFLLALAIIILFSFLFYNEEELPSRHFDRSPENAVIALESGETNRLEMVDEINTLIFHAVILRRISERRIVRFLRNVLLPILTAAFAVSLYLISSHQKPHQYRRRIILIRYIHKSDGKK